MPPKKKEAVEKPRDEALQHVNTPKSRSLRRRERVRRRQAQITSRALFVKPAQGPKTPSDDLSSEDEDLESPRDRDVKRRLGATR